MKKATQSAFLAALLTASAAHAGTAPWYNEASDCRSHWSNAFDSCRIRRDADNRELSGIDAHIAEAQAVLEVANLNLNSAGNGVATLDAKISQQRDVYIPTLETAVLVCGQARDLLHSASGQAVIDARSLLEAQPVATSLAPEAAAALVAGETDSLALSMILEATLTHKTNNQESALKAPLDVQTTDLGLLVSRLLNGVHYSSAPTANLATTTAKAAADDETLLENARQDLTQMGNDQNDAASRSARLEKTASDAKLLFSNLSDRKKALPDLVSGEADCMTTAASYRDTKCADHWNTSAP